MLVFFINRMGEDPKVLEFWSKKLDLNDQKTPSFKDFSKKFNILGTDNEYCCLYLLHNGEEHLVVTSEQYLNEVIEPALLIPGTSHQMTLIDFMTKRGLDNSTKFQYIAGFWLSRREKKVRSCVNYMTTGRTRTLTKEYEMKLENSVFPAIDSYLERITTKCLGTTAKKKPCQKLVKKGRYCYHHRGN